MGILNDFRAALAFFTRLPVGRVAMDSFKDTANYLPAVGLVIGALVALSIAFSALFLPPLLCGMIGCVVWIAVTGGLHLDGVADCGDGLGIESDAARRLEIMKDSRLGTFGAIALFCVLLCKVATLTSILEGLSWRQDMVSDVASLWHIFLLCAFSAMSGRALVLVAMYFPRARPDGLGASMRYDASIRHRIYAILPLVFVCLLLGWKGLGVLLGVLLLGMLIVKIACQRLGGVTGDVFGCLIEMGECAALLFFCLR